MTRGFAPHAGARRPSCYFQLTNATVIVMRQVLVVTLVCCAAACGASVDGSNVNGDDDDTGVDAPPPPPIDAPDVDAAAACFNGRVVFLSFNGETLTKGTSDARLNRASWMTIAQGTAPPYQQGAANRQQQIDDIVNGMRAQLAQFPITIVTDRPPSGEYMMIVYGGTPTQVGSRFGGAVQELDCGDATTRNDVAWVADGVTPAQRVINFSVGAIGFGLGLTATLVTTDCMCGWDNTCQSDNSAACNLTEGITRDPNANQRCAGVATQDETSTFRQAFCQ